MLLKNEDKCLSGKQKLIYDEACLDIINTLKEEVIVAGQYAECLGCDYKNFTTISANGSTSLLINTKYMMRMHFIYQNKPSCDWNAELFEHYRYGWNLTANCSPLYIKQPADNEYLPILTAFIILFFFGTIWYMVKCIYKCTKNTAFVQRLVSSNGSALQSDLGNTSDNTPLVVENPPVAHKQHPNRLKSIDVFRGLCIVLMIFVNYGGGQYLFFRHSVWNGLTVADLVFPWFIWVMGLSYSISLNKKLQRAVPRRQLMVLVLRRTLILIILGLILNSHGKPVTLSSLRIPGVLQRLGVIYLIIGLIESAFTKRSLSEYQFGRLNCIKDILIAAPQWSIVLLCVFVHTMVTFLAYVPGCGRGYIGPGGLHEHGKYANCTGGVAGYIDRAVFGEHMYQHATCHWMYETTKYFDPEGLLSLLTSVFIGYLGFQAGRIYHVYPTPTQRVIRWSSWGFVTCLIGAILCNFSKNGGVIPINKNLWSLSFVLVLGGLAFLLQACLYFLVDVKRKWGGRPFFYPGMNPLILYVGHDIFKYTFPFCWSLENETHAAYLGMNLWGTTLWIAISVFLYKKNIFLSI